jgi:hypothetical protein
MVHFPVGQQGGELLPDGLDDVWWHCGHGEAPPVREASATPRNDLEIHVLLHSDTIPIGASSWARRCRAKTKAAAGNNAQVGRTRIPNSRLGVDWSEDEQRELDRILDEIESEEAQEEPSSGSGDEGLDDVEGEQD